MKIACERNVVLLATHPYPTFFISSFWRLRFLSNCFRFDLMTNKRQNLPGDTINYSSMQFNCFFTNILYLITAEIRVNSIKAETILYTLSSSITVVPKQKPV